ncbi:Tripartite tricarboxylate transporter (TTT) class transporter [Halanaeroarchaeum sp. HSR-CO]|uniref:tripartite tricarboxylate transporter permease n=1 Tax=Halanaeroarchaeum sp. HSR-CO TaxID=2866382 RepID=UPI00217F1A26|nr:tripartite tricarboxylate transporter permease [Halanaeroarchaeum sp. HSR-CO]UWG47916.1 Tripartite tricarboxylate transporter (TTT) class transporter [Halanaeroarchaeum sp. HSR-CO]
MEVIGVRILADPESAALALAFVGGGIALGTVSGLTPGLHVNTVAVIMASLAPTIPAPPHLLGASMLSAGVTHSFLDVVPTLAIGVPDAAMAVSALPGHRLVMGGRGREALRISAVGSASAIATAAVLGIPVTYVMRSVVTTLDSWIPAAIGAIALFLVVTEHGYRATVGGALSLGASGLLGIAFLDVTTGGLVPGGDTLLPLLSGLFGIPILVHAYGGAGVPPQGGPTVAASSEETLGWGMVGALSGSLVAYLPGVSAAVAAAMAFSVLPTTSGDRAFVATVSGVNTSNTIFALFALVALGTPRTGVLVAIERAELPVNLPLVLASIVIAAAVSFVLVPVLGDRYLSLVGSVDPRRLSVAVALLLAVLVGLFTGVPGIGILGIASAVGLFPVHFGARRVHLMGVLLVPIALRGIVG